MVKILMSALLIISLAACQAASTVPQPTANAPVAVTTGPAEETRPALSSPSAEPTDTPALTPTEPQPEATQTPEPNPSTPTATPTVETTSTSENTAATASMTPNRPGGSIIVDHLSVELFDQIPEEYVEKARNLRVVFYNASVGANIDQALDCLAAPSWSASPAHCRRDYTGPDWSWKVFAGDPNSAPARIRFPADSVKYDRSRWDFIPHPGSWQSATADFVNQQVPDSLDLYDVHSYKITYLMVNDQSDIVDPQRGFFVEQADGPDITDVQKLIADHPDKTFFFWTSSLSRSIGSQVSVDFNNQMRQYAAENGLILFDIADIEAHTDTGAACFDNRDGVRFCANNGECEDHPDDGLELAALCQDYTTEIEGGHLGSVSGGKIQLAKAFWVLIARIAGWQP